MEPLNEDALENASPEEIHKALLIQLITGHGQMALMFLGELENPHTSLRQKPDLQAAKVFIDQLEMLAVKTRGNLDAEEQAFLDRTVSTLQTTFARVFDAQQEGS